MTVTRARYLTEAMTCDDCKQRIAPGKWAAVLSHCGGDFFPVTADFESVLHPQCAMTTKLGRPEMMTVIALVTQETAAESLAIANKLVADLAPPQAAVPSPDSREAARRAVCKWQGLSDDERGLAECELGRMLKSVPDWSATYHSLLLATEVLTRLPDFSVREGEST